MSFLLNSFWSKTLEVAEAVIPLWLLVIFAGGVGVVVVFGIISGLISNTYRKKHQLGKYAPAPQPKAEQEEPAQEQAEEQTQQAPEQEEQPPQSAPQEEAQEEQPEQEEAVAQEEQSREAEEEPTPEQAQEPEPQAEQPAPVEQPKQEPAPAAQPARNDGFEGQIAKSSVFQKDTTRDELLASMTDTSSLSEFDFDGDFDEWEETDQAPDNDSFDEFVDEPQQEEQVLAPAPQVFQPVPVAQPVLQEEEEDFAEFEPEEEEDFAQDVWVADEVEDPDADLETNLWVADEFVMDEEDEDNEGEIEEDSEDENGFSREVPKYLRSFRSRLIQSSDNLKHFYSVLKNELLSYKKMRSSESWNGEAFLQGRKTYAKMLVVGKTLCVFLALNPAEFDPRTFHHRDKSGIKKYEATPLLMRITSEQAMRRTLSLIATLAYDNGFVKGGSESVDYASQLVYKTDEELLAVSLIKHNLKAVDELAVGNDSPYRTVAMVSKKQVGNLTNEDIARLQQKNDEVKRVKGRFVIGQNDGVYRFKLMVGEKTTLFVSGAFKSQAMAIKGVSVYKAVLSDPDTQVKYCTMDGQYFYILKATRNWVSVMYPTKNACLKGYETAKAAIDDSAIVVE